ncbi:EF-hand domain-containing protein [Pseudoscourfieldia marina]
MVGGTAAPLGSVREMLHGIKLDECPALLRTMLAKFDKNGNGIIDPDELPIANDDGISIKAFPEDVQPILRGIDEEGNGKLEMGELTEMAITYAELKKANKEGSIAIKTLPKELQPTLKVFDVDGDGTVAPMELARGAELYKGSKKTAKRLMTFSGVLLLILCALVGVIVGLVAMVVENSKETKTDSKTGITYAKGSSKPSATAKVTKTDSIYNAVKKSASALRAIGSLTLDKPDGSSLFYTITGAETHGGAPGKANAVAFYSARGDVINVTATSLNVTKEDGSIVMTDTVVAERSRRRRLLDSGSGSDGGSGSSMTAEYIEELEDEIKGGKQFVAELQQEITEGKQFVAKLKQEITALCLYGQCEIDITHRYCGNKNFE